jgi:hypothetical protein
VGSNPTATALTCSAARSRDHARPGIARPVSVLVSVALSSFPEDRDGARTKSEPATHRVGETPRRDGHATPRYASGEPPEDDDPHICRPKEIADSHGDVLADAGGDVLVPGSHAAVGPAHDRHDGAFGDAEQEEHGRGGVTGVMQPTVSDARPRPAGSSSGCSRSAGWWDFRPRWRRASRSPATAIRRGPRSAACSSACCSSRVTSCSGRPTVRFPARDLVSSVSGRRGTRMFSSQYSSQPATVKASPARVSVPASRSFSSSRTLRVTSARLLPWTCRRPGCRRP